MKKAILFVAAVCVLLSGLAFAQKWTQKAKVSVPFDFVVGTTSLPAGDYFVSTPEGMSGSVLHFTNIETGAGAFASNIDVSVKKADRSNPTSNLIFVLDSQDRHVLHQIWLFDDDHGHDLIHPKGVPEPQ